VSHLDYDQHAHLLDGFSLKKVFKSKVAAVGLVAATGGAAAPLAAKMYKDADDAERRAARKARAEEAASQAAAWEAEEQRTATWETFWRDWEAALTLREQVGVALANAQDRFGKLERRASVTNTWPISFDDRMSEARIAMRAATYSVKGAPPVSFTSPGSTQDELDAALEMNRLERNDFEQALRRIEEVDRSLAELETQATENESRDRMKAMRGRRSRRGSGLGGLGADPWYSYTAVGTAYYHGWERGSKRKRKRRKRKAAAAAAAAREAEGRRVETGKEYAKAFGRAEDMRFQVKMLIDQAKHALGLASTAVAKLRVQDPFDTQLEMLVARVYEAEAIMSGVLKAEEHGLDKQTEDYVSAQSQAAKAQLAYRKARQKVAAVPAVANNVEVQARARLVQQEKDAGLGGLGFIPGGPNLALAGLGFTLLVWWSRRKQ
jgi:hypothetical protein